MARKAFSLDYDIERDVDRVAAVKQILDSLEKTPSNADLELMGNYIMYGRGEDGKNSVQRGETLEQTKFSSWKRESDKFSSLDEFLENPLNDQGILQPAVGEKKVYVKRTTQIRRPKYDKNGNIIDRGHMDIPFMQQQWEAIDRLQHLLNVSEGKEPPDEHTAPLSSPLQVYRLRHTLIDVRRHQFYILDAYQPQIHFLNVKPNKTPTIDFNQDSAYWIPIEEWQDRVDHRLVSTISQDLSDYETKEDAEGHMWVRWVVRHQAFDWENQQHIATLLLHYSSIYQQTWDKPDSWGRTLIFDFDRYFDMCGFSPIEEYIVTRKIDKASHPQIEQEVYEKFGVKWSQSSISTLLNRRVPRTMAAMATRTRLMVEYPKRMTCRKCGRDLPAHKLFFPPSHNYRTGFDSCCRECDKKMRELRAWAKEVMARVGQA